MQAQTKAKTENCGKKSERAPKNPRIGATAFSLEDCCNVMFWLGFHNPLIWTLHRSLFYPLLFNCLYVWPYFSSMLITWAWINSTKKHNFGPDQIKAFADDKLNIAKRMIVPFDRVENTVEKKGENAGYQHFLLLPQYFPKPSQKLGLCSIYSRIWKK